MTDVISGQAALISLEAGLTVTVTSGDVFSTGLVRRTSNNGGNLSGNRISNIAANSSLSFGPFPADRSYSIEAVGAGGKLSYVAALQAYDYATQRGNIEPFVGSFTLKTEDMGKVFRCDDTSNVTITVPNDFAQGFNCGFIMYGTGTVTLSFAAGATNKSGKIALSTQYQRGSLFCAKQIAANNAAEILVGGDFS
jgi:hypothetical protein